MRHNRIDYDVIWISNEEFEKRKNNPRCELYKKENIIVNKENMMYVHCGEFKNRPNTNTIDQDLDNECKKRI